MWNLFVCVDNAVVYSKLCLKWSVNMNQSLSQYMAVRKLKTQWCDCSTVSLGPCRNTPLCPLLRYMTACLEPGCIRHLVCCGKRATAPWSILRLALSQNSAQGLIVVSQGLMRMLVFDKCWVAALGGCPPSYSCLVDFRSVTGVHRRHCSVYSYCQRTKRGTNAQWELSAVCEGFASKCKKISTCAAR